MGLYSHIGGYSGYKKNNKEREALDYYSTPTKEVENILETIKIPFNGCSILEPCAGGGHMLKGIENYLDNYNYIAPIIATDVKKRNNIQCKHPIESGQEYDFLSDEYPYDSIDYIIMNPPYAIIEPFTMKALTIANKGVLMLGRLQFLEAEGRYLNIFSQCPPSDVYVYVDRIACFKNGDESIKADSAQAYAWFYWDFKKIGDTKVYWIRRANKK